MKEFCTIIEKGETIAKIINDYFNQFEPFWGRLNDFIDTLNYVRASCVWYEPAGDTENNTE